MRTGAGAAVSRLGVPMVVGVRFTVTADLAGADILRPLYGYPSGQNKPSYDVDHQDKPEQD